MEAKSLKKFILPWCLMAVGMSIICFTLPIEDTTTAVIIVVGLVLTTFGGMLNGKALTEEKQG